MNKIKTLLAQSTKQEWIISKSDDTERVQGYMTVDFNIQITNWDEKGNRITSLTNIKGNTRNCKKLRGKISKSRRNAYNFKHTLSTILSHMEIEDLDRPITKRLHHE